MEYCRRSWGVLVASRPTFSGTTGTSSRFKNLSIEAPRSLHQKKSLVKVSLPDGFEIADGTHINLGDTVELKNGDFLRVKKYEKHTKGSSYRKRVVSGSLFRRVIRTIGLSREYFNEVYRVDYLGGLNTRLSSEERGIQDISTSKVLRKRELLLENSPDHVLERKNEENCETTECLDMLFCRWRQEFRTKGRTKVKPADAFNLKRSSLIEAAYLPLRPEECDQRRSNKTNEEGLGQEKRDPEGSRKTCEDQVIQKSSIYGPLTSVIEDVEALALEDSDEDRHPSPTLNTSPTPKYTFRDLFSGAGGASCGAEAAGLEVLGGFDHDANACETYRLNFPHAQCLLMDARDHASIRDGEWKTDIVHMSPPCQPFSNANSTPSAKKDKVNIAANSVVGFWLDKTVPRIATVEQTSGLLWQRKHRKYLDAMIQAFTSRGFSIRLNLLNLADFGVPQARKRLVIVAARANEPLPDPPTATHSARPKEIGLRKYVTVNETIDHIPIGSPNHDIPKTFDSRKVPLKWFRDKGNGLLPYVIITKSPSCHPSRLRGMTHREHSNLQTLLLGFRFSKRGVGKHIGNAAPPVFAGKVFAGVREHLLRQDGFGA